jgi:hypothetical protein
MGCPVVQGYFVAPPMSAPRLTAWLARADVRPAPLARVEPDDDAADASRLDASSVR